MKLTTENVSHYKWGNHCHGWRFMDHSELSVIYETMPPGTSEKKHYHQHTQQFFYILQGHAVFELEKQKLQVFKGQGVTVKPGLKHHISNQADTELHFLVISQPGHTQKDRIEP